MVTGLPSIFGWVTHRRSYAFCLQQLEGIRGSLAHKDAYQESLEWEEVPP